MKLKIYWIALIVTIAVALIIVWFFQSPYPRFEPQWYGPVVQIDPSQLPRSKYSILNFEFSSDSRYLAIYNYNDDFRSLVFDLQGKIVKNAVDPNGRLTPQYAPLFKLVKQKKRIARSLPAEMQAICKMEKIEPEKYRYDGFWEMDEDASICLTIPPIKRNHVEDLKTVEMWRLRPVLEKIWSIDLPESYLLCTWGRFFERNGKLYILLIMNRPNSGINDGKPATDAFILEQQTGKLVDRIPLGGNETVAQLKAYQAKLRPQKKLLEGRESLMFCPSAADLNTSRSLLALCSGSSAGSSFGRRIRVLGFESPYKIVFEANTYEHPYLAGYGGWVNEIRFAGNNYLVVEYHYYERGSFYANNYHLIDIFDVRNWKRIWHRSGDRTINHVILSPNGKKLTFDHKGMIEIRDFVPQPDNIPN